MNDYIKIGTGVFKKSLIASLVVGKEGKTDIIRVVYRDDMLCNIPYPDFASAYEDLIQAHKQINEEQ